MRTEKRKGEGFEKALPVPPRPPWLLTPDLADPARRRRFRPEFSGCSRALFALVAASLRRRAPPPALPPPPPPPGAAQRRHRPRAAPTNGKQPASATIIKQQQAALVDVDLSDDLRRRGRADRASRGGFCTPLAGILTPEPGTAGTTGQESVAHPSAAPPARVANASTRAGDGGDARPHAARGSRREISAKWQKPPVILRGV